MLPFLLSLSLAHAGWEPQPSDLKAYSHAIVALGGSDLNGATQGFRAVLSRDPSCGMARHGLAMALLRAGKAPEALSELETALGSYPGQVELLVGVSSASFVLQDFGRARKAAELAVTADPASIDAHAVLQQALLRVGDHRAAQADLAAAKAALPDPVIACFEVQLAAETGDSATAASRLEACKRAGTLDLLAGAMSRVDGGAGYAATVGDMASRLGLNTLVLQSQAVDRFNEGDYAGTLALLDPLLEARSQQADARVLRARARQELGDKAGARADFEAALSGATYVDVHGNGAVSGILRASDAAAFADQLADGAGELVKLLIEAKDPSAEARLAALDKQMGPHPALVGARARLLLAQGKAAQVTPALEGGLQAWPGHPRLREVAALLATQSPQALGPKAVEALSRSGDWTDRYNLAFARRKSGDAAGCLALVDAAIADLKPSAEVAGKLSIIGYGCAVDQGDAARADALLAKVGGADKVPATTRYNHALLHKNAGTPEAALRLVAPIAERPPADNAELASAATSLAIQLYGNAKDWGHAVPLATAAAVKPYDQLWLGSKLAADGQIPQARALLSRGCPRLAGDEKARCDKLLGQVGGPL